MRLPTVTSLTIRRISMIMIQLTHLFKTLDLELTLDFGLLLKRDINTRSNTKATARNTQMNLPMETNPTIRKTLTTTIQSTLPSKIPDSVPMLDSGPSIKELLTITFKTSHSCK
jgi:hypothetical protein